MFVFWEGVVLVQMAVRLLIPAESSCHTLCPMHNGLLWHCAWPEAAAEVESPVCSCSTDDPSAFRQVREPECLRVSSLPTLYLAVLQPCSSAYDDCSGWLCRGFHPPWSGSAPRLKIIPWLCCPPPPCDMHWSWASEIMAGRAEAGAEAGQG